MQSVNGIRSTRRGVLAGAAAGVGAGALLAGCAKGTAGTTGTAPAVQQGGIQLVFQANSQGVGWNRTTQGLYQAFVDDNYNAKTAGVHVSVDPGGWGNPQGQIAASVARSGYADVVAGTDIATFQTGGWVLPLDAYLKKDNVSTSIWSPGHVSGLTFGGQLFGVPSYDGPGVIAYRQDLLDGLGLEYPDETWTAKSAADLWKSCAGTDSKGVKRHGAAMIFDEAATTWQYWLTGWGAQVSNPSREQCLADTPAAAAAMDYLAGLHTAGVLESGSGVDDLAAGRVAFSMCGGWNVFDEAEKLGAKFKWDLLPVPNWPSGRATFGNIDFYALNAASQDADAAWALMNWLTVQPDWQRFQMRATMVQPCLLTLWDEWETIVKSVAPPLQNKALHWYKDAALGYAFPPALFAHAPTQANAVVDDWLGKIWNGQISAQGGLAQLAHQVNALEQAAASEVVTGGATSKAFPTVGPAIAAVQPGL